MKVLMFGWEFPPYSSGGLGTACYGLTKSLSKQNVDITFVVPYAQDSEYDFLNLVPTNVKLKQINSLLQPYLTPHSYNLKIKSRSKHGPIYGRFLFEEVKRYSDQVPAIIEGIDFDVIHCHDWMTFDAGITAKKLTGKPLIVHVHATEFDRTGGTGVNQLVYDVEKHGMEYADKVIAVSAYTKSKIMEHYLIPEDKIEVVHNAVEQKESFPLKMNKKDKIVLFLGRITLQKGPDYFLYAAKRALEIDPHIRFVIAGSGDMERMIIEKSAELGISNNVLFAGFLSGDDVEKAYSMADLYVMPSVSEPFGITALEALQSGTPILISKQSGVSEVVQHCLKADFWDVEDIANKIIAALQYAPLHEALIEGGSLEVKKFNWDEPAKKCVQIYNKLAPLSVSC